MSAAPLVCLRCGGFESRDRAPLAGVALCRECLTGDRRGPDPMFNWAPAFMVRRRLATLAAAALGVVALGTLSAPALARELVASGPHSFAALAALGVLSSLAVFLASSWLPHGSVRWKHEILKGLGLEVDRAEHFRLALYAWRRPTLTDWQNPVELGLVAAGEGGLAFLGQDGSRVVLPREQIVGAGVELIGLLWPPRAALRLELGDGARRYIALLDHPTRRENAAALTEWARRLAPSVR